MQPLVRALGVVPETRLKCLYLFLSYNIVPVLVLKYLTENIAKELISTWISIDFSLRMICQSSQWVSSSSFGRGLGYTMHESCFALCSQAYHRPKISPCQQIPKTKRRLVYPPTYVPHVLCSPKPTCSKRVADLPPNFPHIPVAWHCMALREGAKHHAHSRIHIAIARRSPLWLFMHSGCQGKKGTISSSLWASVKPGL